MRRKFDRYPTKDSLTLTLLKHVYINKGSTVIEPCAGEGDMVRVLRKHPNISKLYTSDKDRHVVLKHGWNWTGDATVPDVYDIRDQFKRYPQRRFPYITHDGIDWAITNPPFNEAAQILEALWDRTDIENIALLLRLSFLEPTTGTRKHYGRRELLKRLSIYFSDLIILGSPRPSYTEDGNTDAVTSAWMVWRKYATREGVRVVPEANWTHENVTSDDVRQAADLADVRNWGRGFHISPRQIA